MDNKCVCCGAVIPEGLMVCPKCEEKLKERRAMEIEAIGSAMQMLRRERQNGYEQGCKETAENIYRELMGHGTTYVKKWIKRHYGVEIGEKG